MSQATFVLEGRRALLLWPCCQLVRLVLTPGSEPRAVPHAQPAMHAQIRQPGQFPADRGRNYLVQDMNARTLVLGLQVAQSGLLQPGVAVARAVLMRPMFAQQKGRWWL